MYVVGDDFNERSRSNSQTNGSSLRRISVCLRIRSGPLWRCGKECSHFFFDNLYFKLSKLSTITSHIPSHIHNLPQPSNRTTQNINMLRLFFRLLSNFIYFPFHPFDSSVQNVTNDDQDIDDQTSLPFCSQVGGRCWRKVWLMTIEKSMDLFLFIFMLLQLIWRTALPMMMKKSITLVKKKNRDGTVLPYLSASAFNLEAGFVNDDHWRSKDTRACLMRPCFMMMTILINYRMLPLNPSCLWILMKYLKAMDETEFIIMHACNSMTMKMQSRFSLELPVIHSTIFPVDDNGESRSLFAASAYMDFFIRRIRMWWFLHHSCASTNLKTTI